LTSNRLRIGDLFLFCTGLGIGGSSALSRSTTESRAREAEAIEAEIPADVPAIAGLSSSTGLSIAASQGWRPFDPPSGAWHRPLVSASGVAVVVLDLASPPWYVVPKIRYVYLTCSFKRARAISVLLGKVIIRFICSDWQRNIFTHAGGFRTFCRERFSLYVV
jgi:hypothetical protein